LQQVRDYVRANLGALLNLAELVAFVEMHPHYFASLFKQSTRISPYQYILQHRIASAQQYLDRAHLSIVEIFVACGISFNSHRSWIALLVKGLDF
jgi:AraC family transcriptional regulator